VDVPTIAEERAELSLDSGLSYREDEPVVDAEGRAVALAGKPPGWHDGAVFVPAAKGGVDLAWLGGRVAEASRALYQELLDLE
jgi:hypothetical protein